MLAGSSPTSLPAFNPDVTVDATTTLGSGGTADWWGRSYTCRRLSDNALVMVYRRSTGHNSNTSTALHIKFSANNGASWTAEDTKLGGGAVTGFPMNPSTGNVSYGEGRIYVAPNGDLILLMWSVTGISGSGTGHGTWMSRSTDGGNTWGATSQVDFGGGLNQDLTFATDGWFVHDGVIYVGARVYNSISTTDSYVVLVKSADNGTTWEYVSDITAAGSDTQEVGLAYVGDGYVIALIGSLNNDETLLGISDDLGLTWTTSDVTGTGIGVSRRHSIYTMAQLMGLPGWENDNRLLVTAFENQTPGDSQDRRNAVWVGRWNRSAKTVSFDGPHYLDSTTEDAGYSDIFYAGSAGQFSVVAYQGTLNAASLKQYDFTVDLAA